MGVQNKYNKSGPRTENGSYGTKRTMFLSNTRSPVNMNLASTARQIFHKTTQWFFLFFFFFGGGGEKHHQNRARIVYVLYLCSTFDSRY